MMKTRIITAICMMVGLNVIAQIPNYVPTNGLVGWWPFNGNANDESGNGNNGTVDGAILTDDRFGNTESSYGFNGISDLISITTSTHPTGNVEITYSLWIYSLNNSGNNALLNVGDNGITNKRSAIGNEITGGISYIAQANDVASNYFSSLNQWHNIVITKVGETVNFFLDGILLNDGNITSGQDITNTKIVFGSNGTNWGGGEFFNGKLDDIGIWNRALTEEEIQNLYNANICYDHVTVTDTLIINFNMTGFNPVTYDHSIEIYPNPTSDHITINYGDFIGLNGYTLSIFNPMGQLVHTSNITQQQEYLDLNTWGGVGVYQVVVYNPQGVPIETKQIVLQ
jgi:hypothetical protein